MYSDVSVIFPFRQPFILFIFHVFSTTYFILVPGFDLLRYLLIFIFFFFFSSSSCFSSLGASWKNSIYRFSPNHLTIQPHLLNHSHYYPSALCFASTLKLDWWEHASGNERQLFLLCSASGVFFSENPFMKTWNLSILSATKSIVKLSPTWFQHRYY